MKMNEDRSILDVNLGDQEYGVATQKDSELSGNVANAIQEMLDNGTIAAYIDKWNQGRMQPCLSGSK